MARAPIPPVLPGEPTRPMASPPKFLAHMTIRLLGILIIGSFTAFLWPLYLLGGLLLGWPPNVPRIPQILRYLREAWSPKPLPGLHFLQRCWLTLCILRKCVWTLAVCIMPGLVSLSAVCARLCHRLRRWRRACCG